MTPCPSCGTHRKPASTCPNCGSAPSALRSTMAAVLLGLAVAGCAGDGGDKTDSTGDTGDTDTSPTTGVDYGMAPLAELVNERLPPQEDERKAPEKEDADPR